MFLFRSTSAPDTIPGDITVFGALGRFGSGGGGFPSSSTILSPPLRTVSAPSPPHSTNVSPIKQRPVAVGGGAIYAGAAGLGTFRPFFVGPTNVAAFPSPPVSRSSTPPRKVPTPTASPPLIPRQPGFGPAMLPLGAAAAGPASLLFSHHQSQLHSQLVQLSQQQQHQHHPHPPSASSVRNLSPQKQASPHPPAPSAATVVLPRQSPPAAPKTTTVSPVKSSPRPQTVVPSTAQPHHHHHHQQQQQQQPAMVLTYINGQPYFIPAPAALSPRKPTTPAHPSARTTIAATTSSPVSHRGTPNAAAAAAPSPLRPSPAKPLIATPRQQQPARVVQSTPTKPTPATAASPAPVFASPAPKAASTPAAVAASPAAAAVKGSVVATYAIFGLGNPKSDGQLHNIGFACVDEVIRHLAPHAHEKKKMAKAEVVETLVESKTNPGQHIRVFLCKPMTCMNNSGESVSAFLKKHPIPLQNIMVIHDDIDLALGALRIRNKGSDGGQNGVASILDYLEDADEDYGEDSSLYPFIRVRVGVGRPAAGVDPARHVLRKFLPAEVATIYPAVLRARDCASAFVQGDGIDKLMNSYNVAAPSIAQDRQKSKEEKKQQRLERQQQNEGQKKGGKKAKEQQQKEEETVAAAAAAADVVSPPSPPPKAEQEQAATPAEPAPSPIAAAPLPPSPVAPAAAAVVEEEKKEEQKEAPAPSKNNKKKGKNNNQKEQMFHSVPASKSSPQIDAELEKKFASAGQRGAAVAAADELISQRRQEKASETNLSPELRSVLERRKTLSEGK